MKQEKNAAAFFCLLYREEEEAEGFEKSCSVENLQEEKL